MEPAIEPAATQQRAASHRVVPTGKYRVSSAQRLGGVGDRTGGHERAGGIRAGGVE